MGFLPTPLAEKVFNIAPYVSLKHPNSLCAMIQLKLGDCLEAYGLFRARTKCADLYFDYCECRQLTFQKERYRAIQNERMKQYREGKLKTPFEEHPPIDSFIYFE